MKFNLVALEETEYYTDQEFINKTGKIFTIYMYNPEEHTYCCEITPSYYLIPVDCYGEKVAGIEDEEEKEKLYTELEEILITSEPIYSHCSSIDIIPETSQDGKRLKFTSENDFEDEEEALEYYQGNACL